jgi:hypothetical protein
MPDFSNRLFDGGYQGAQWGEEYTTEFVADAIDEDGYQYSVYWQFQTTKGEEPEDLSNYPWDDEHVSRVRAQ